MATRSAKIDQKADLIWAIADKLTGVYKPHEYGDVILPLTVIRRFDCILSDTKDAVLQKYDEVKNLPMKDILLRKASKKDFYNTSKYTFERLMDDPDHIEENFREYLNKFSANVRDILEKFKFDGHITTMANKGILYIVLKEYTTDRGNLHPNEISNLEMGYIFEEIIRRFSESHNEDAGQHYTPREVIQLMVNILFYDDNDILSGNNVAKMIYDPACGTGGMLSVAEEYLHSLNASTELVSFGQEINDQTFAICKADMLIKGNNADYIKDGNTLSDDQFAGSTFDYMHKNLSFFAFTATPKGKTLQLFGQKDAEGIYRPFHIYSMRQAIEEHFILDVLQNYMTYKMYYKIAKIIEDNPEFDTTAGSKAIINYETLHPHNISQKTAIMLEHFMNVTRHKIGGRAKAMVVTP